MKLSVQPEDEKMEVMPSHTTIHKSKRKRKSRSRGLRKTTGCLTCRKRHLKCDEDIPFCGQCTKSKQICVYAAPNLHITSLAETTSTSPVDEQLTTDAVIPPATEQLSTSSPDSSPNTNHDTGNIRVGSSDGERTEAASGLLHLNSAGPANISITTAAQFDDTLLAAAETPPDAALSRWFGLLVEDVDQGFGSCPELLAEPGSRPVFMLSRPLAHEERSFNFGLQWERQPWRGVEPSKLSFAERSLLENFVQNVAAWIDLFDPARCFSTLVPHLAMHDTGLMNAVLALSARHLSLRPDGADEQRDKSVALNYYYKTLHYLQEGMSHESYTTSLELLATALIVSTYEMLDDTGNGWERHLKGVFWIQRSQVIHGESGGLRSAVWWAWLRQDVWAAFRERRKTLSFWTPTKPYDMLTPHEIALRSVWIFARAVDYCSTEEVDNGKNDVQSRLEHAEKLLEILEDWERNLTIEFTPLPYIDNSNSTGFQPIWINPPALGVSVQLNCAARILLLLHKPSLGGRREFMEQQHLVSKCINTICGIALTLTDDASSLMSSQCLFIAGMCVQETAKRQVLLENIDLCQRRSGWPTRSLSEELKSDWSSDELMTRPLRHISP
ncbi:hypothetical protein B0O99DRAFT_647720 [Bisporella sp. PMI_857]|nr:hypothetical protein B0O99DRAFT_647720 [Bisporella sp. PMI_857]